MSRFLYVVLILTTATVSLSVELIEVYKWKYVDFVWRNMEEKTNAINNNQYNPYSCALYDVDKAPDGRVFVTSVRDEGVPASLMTVSNQLGPGGPLLDPYPNWSWYSNENDCNYIISVYRVSILCNHIFVLDCGKIGETKVCPPKLLIFNLEDDMLVKSIEIPPNIAENESGVGLFVTPLAYDPSHCHDINDVTVFMADIEGYGLAIYNGKDFCRVESDFMNATNPNFTINDQSFYLEDGILGLTIINENLFYSSLGGNAIYKMDMCNEKECSELTRSEADKITQLAGTLSGQTAAIASKQCALFFSNIPDNSILCQDATKGFNSTNTVLIVKDSKRLQFASGMKVVNHGTTLMMLTNRFQRVYTSTLDLNETNYRVLGISMEEVREETNCFDSCKYDYDKSDRHEPWRHKYWQRKLWHYFDKRNKLKKYFNHEKYDNKDHKYGKKDDKYDKKHKGNKYF
ncbi:hypothetical protein PUN28_002774 [Cardiocondyla obscurior]